MGNTASNERALNQFALFAPKDGLALGPFAPSAGDKESTNIGRSAISIEGSIASGKVLADISKVKKKTNKSKKNK